MQQKNKNNPCTDTDRIRNGLRYARWYARKHGGPNGRFARLGETEVEAAAMTGVMRAARTWEKGLPWRTHMERNVRWAVLDAVEKIPSEEQLDDKTAGKLLARTEPEQVYAGLDDMLQGLIPKDRNIASLLAGGCCLEEARRQAGMSRRQFDHTLARLRDHLEYLS